MMGRSQSVEIGNNFSDFTGTRKNEEDKFQDKPSILKKGIKFHFYFQQADNRVINSATTKS